MYYLAFAFVVSSVCSCLCCISCWRYSSHAQCSTAGWAYHLLPKPQPSWILPVPSWCRGSDMHAEWQCHAKDSRGVGNIGMELLGSISVHECSCQPTEKGPSAVSCVPHVCLSWVPHYRNRLRWGTRDYRCGIVRDTEFCFLGARLECARLLFPCIQILDEIFIFVVFAGCFKILLSFFLRKSCKAWNVTVKKFINDV